MNLVPVEAGTLAQEMATLELADNTRAAYQKGWRNFATYCGGIGLDDPLEADHEDVAQWIIYLSTTMSARGNKPLHPGTIAIYKSGVSKAFEIAGLTSTL